MMHKSHNMIPLELAGVSVSLRGGVGACDRHMPEHSQAGQVRLDVCKRVRPSSPQDPPQLLSAREMLLPMSGTLVMQQSL